jgi:uncharacterized protein with HEPN domain
MLAAEARTLLVILRLQQSHDHGRVRASTCCDTPPTSFAGRSKAIDFSKGKQRHDLDDDELLRLALTKLVEIVGEAAKSISPEGRTAMPQVPWRAAARMRDRLVHHYFDINLDILWQTITGDLPQLLATLPSEDEADPRQAR